MQLARNEEMLEGYHETRLAPDERRSVLWKTLVSAHFSKLIPVDGSVLELGCGHCDFINNVKARRRIAVDMWPGFTAYADKGVECVVAPATEIDFIEDGSIDFAFASNLFEHLPQEQFSLLLSRLKPKLSPRGTINILQPNYRYCYKEYFDDYTHVSVYSHISLTDFLGANGFDAFDVVPRFLPLTIKSRLPVWPVMIRAYLALPVKPMGKQMWIRARPSA